LKIADKERVRILTLVNFYYPGHRGGGAIRSTFNLTERLGQRFDFYVVTADHDFLDDSAYVGVRSNHWQRVRAANVFYAGVGELSLARIRRLIIDVNPSIIYLNSFFHPVFAIRVLFLQRLGLISKVPVVLAPRGELAAGALAIKAGRKRWFRVLAAGCGLYRNVTWQASCQEEAADIRQNFRPGLSTKRRVIVAPDLVDGGELLGTEPSHTKIKDQLKIVFVSRISAKKNLLTAIQILRAVRANIQFDIYGPIDDPEYWEDCRRALSALPKNVSISYFGDVPNSRVPSVLADFERKLRARDR
jgi:glycosyltransferase involved in cell wall biosynthesis